MKIIHIYEQFGVHKKTKDVKLSNVYAIQIYKSIIGYICVELILKDTHKKTLTISKYKSDKNYLMVINYEPWMMIILDSTKIILEF